MELIQARFGPQLINGLVDTNEATKYLADKFGIPEKLVRTPEQQQQIMQQLAQMQQAQQAQQAGLEAPQGQMPPQQG